MIRLVIPFPPRTLHPNSRPHWTARYKASTKYKNDCFYLALTARYHDADPAAPIPIKITWHPKSKIPGDYDGCIANLKAGLDGIAQAWGVNDSRFRLALEFGHPVKGGKVVLEVENSADEIVVASHPVVAISKVMIDDDRVGTKKSDWKLIAETPYQAVYQHKTTGKKRVCAKPRGGN